MSAENSRAPSTREEAILAGATRRLNQNPAASMADLAQAIGISRATLHRHFATRDELLHRLGLRAIGDWEQGYREVGVAEATASGDPEVLAGTLRRLVERYVATIDEYGFALTDDVVAGNDDVREWIERLEEQGVEFIAAAQRAGVLDPDLPARWISDALYGLLIGARDSLRAGNVARRDLADLVVRTLLRGVGASGHGARGGKR
jgi:AcrR family transcriptional regulator